jgi:hypothetical protein
MSQNDLMDFCKVLFGFSLGVLFCAFACRETKDEAMEDSGSYE